MKKLALLLSLLAACASVRTDAAEIYSARFSTSPAYVFVNQAFDLQFEIEVSPGSTIQDLRIGNFPQDRLQLTLGQLEQMPTQSSTRNGRRVDVLRFLASAKAGTAGEQVIRATLQGMSTERSGGGFFSFMQSHQVQKAIEPFTLIIRELPVTGRPADFSGAIGIFKMTASLSSLTVQPGDILTLTLDLSGEGNLNASAPVLSAVDGFKTYPTKTREATATHLKLEKIYIPQSTAAVTIPAITFTSFNPAKQKYETLLAGPFHLRFTQPTESVTNAVRLINTADAPAEKTPAILNLPRAAALWQAGKHVTRSTARRTEVHFAPSRAALALFVLPAQQRVQVLETQGDWARIDLDGRRGWLPLDDLQK